MSEDMHRTTIDLEIELYDRLRRAAYEKRTTMREIIVSALKDRFFEKKDEDLREDERYLILESNYYTSRILKVLSRYMPKKIAARAIFRLCSKYNISLVRFEPKNVPDEFIEDAARLIYYITDKRGEAQVFEEISKILKGDVKG